jgi:hypothetical protein
MPSRANLFSILNIPRLPAFSSLRTHGKSSATLRKLPLPLELLFVIPEGNLLGANIQAAVALAGKVGSVFMGLDVCLKDRIHAGKVTLSIRLEPLHHIAVQAEMDGSLPARHHDRAVLQNSAPRDSASGASGMVLSSPRSRMALIWLRECRTMVDLSFISARFLGTDDAN